MRTGIGPDSAAGSWASFAARYPALKRSMSMIDAARPPARRLVQVPGRGGEELGGRPFLVRGPAGASMTPTMPTRACSRRSPLTRSTPTERAIGPREADPPASPSARCQTAAGHSHCPSADASAALRHEARRDARAERVQHEKALREHLVERFHPDAVPDDRRTIPRDLMRSADHPSIARLEPSCEGTR